MKSYKMQLDSTPDHLFPCHEIRSKHLARPGHVPGQSVVQLDQSTDIEGL